MSGVTPWFPMPRSSRRPSPSGLDLVGDEQDPGLVQDALVGGEQALRRHREPADALDRLGDERGDVPAGRGREHVPEVVHAGVDVRLVRHPGELREVPVGAVQEVRVQRGVGEVPPGPVAGDARRAERPAVVALPQREDLVAAPRVRRQQQRRLVRLRPGVDEEHLRVRDARQPGDLLGELDLPAHQVRGGGVHDAGRELPLHRLPHLGHVVPEHVREDAREEVEVAVPLGVGHAAALAADDLDGFAVVERHPRRHDRPVALEQVRVFRHAPSLVRAGRTGHPQSVTTPSVPLTVCWRLTSCNGERRVS